MMNRKVSIIVCCYNEESNIPVVIQSIHNYMKQTGYTYEIIVVDDGSTDRSLTLLKEMCQSDTQLFYIEFSRNFGHQNALKAGLDHATGDCVISMDGDMQHPPQMLPMLISKWEEGYDIVYTRREEDPSLPEFKRWTSNCFYRLLNFLSDLKIEPGTADFRLIDRRVVDVIAGISGGELFMRGLINWVGFKQYAIDYEPGKRFSGESKYTLKKMFALAAQGITSFSVKPLHLSMYLGLAISFLSFLYFPYALVSYFFFRTISGWTSLIMTVSFFGGLQLFILGIIGLYIGKIFIRSRHYPPYILKSTNLKQGK